MSESFIGKDTLDLNPQQISPAGIDSSSSEAHPGMSLEGAVASLSPRHQVLPEPAAIKVIASQASLAWNATKLLSILISNTQFQSQATKSC